MNRDKNEKIQGKISKLYLEKYGGMSGDEVLIYLTEELIKGTNKLNILTIVLIVLTAVLIVLTGVSIWKF